MLCDYCNIVFIGMATCLVWMQIKGLDLSKDLHYELPFYCTELWSNASSDMFVDSKQWADKIYNRFRNLCKDYHKFKPVVKEGKPGSGQKKALTTTVEGSIGATHFLDHMTEATKRPRQTSLRCAVSDPSHSELFDLESCSSTTTNVQHCDLASLNSSPPTDEKAE